MNVDTFRLCFLQYWSALVVSLRQAVSTYGCVVQSSVAEPNRDTDDAVQKQSLFLKNIFFS